MRNKWTLIVGLISLLAALGGGLYAYRFYDSLITTARVVTVNRVVPPYTPLAAELLIERTVPRGLLQEPIYQDAASLIGRVSTTTLYPDQIIYRHQAVPAAQFRYVDDPTLEIVSFPVDAARAVGGQVKIGQRINVYRVRELSNQAARAGSAAVVALDGVAEAELLAEAVPVVDVRARQGEAVGQVAVSSQVEQSARPEALKPLQIITVAVDPDTARSLIELAVEEQGEYTLWVTLSPIVDNLEERE